MASLTFQNFIFFLGSGRPRPDLVQNVVFIFQKSLSASEAGPQGPIEKEMCHLKAEKKIILDVF